MQLLLLSLHAGAVRPFLEASVPDTGRSLRIGYVIDAQAAYAGAPFVEAEYERVLALGHEVIRMECRELAPSRLDSILTDLDALYVAGGSTFALLESLRITGNDAVIVSHVRAGLPYIGCSAGSIITGPDIIPASLMDDPEDGPLLTSTTGLGLVSVTVIPHADGQLPQYPPALIAETLSRFGTSHALQPLRDDQALLVQHQQRTVVHSGEGKAPEAWI